jgi:hypothetical protein
VEFCSTLGLKERLPNRAHAYPGLSHGPESGVPKGLDCRVAGTGRSVFFLNLFVNQAVALLGGTTRRADEVSHNKIAIGLMVSGAAFAGENTGNAPGGTGVEQSTESMGATNKQRIRLLLPVLGLSKAAVRQREPNRALALSTSLHPATCSC